MYIHEYLIKYPKIHPILSKLSLNIHKADVRFIRFVAYLR